MRERPYPSPIWWPCPQYSAPRHDELRQWNKQATPLTACFHGERVPDKVTIVTGRTTPQSPGGGMGAGLLSPWSSCIVTDSTRNEFAPDPAYSRMSGRCRIAIWFTMVCTYDLTSAAAKASIRWCRDAFSISETKSPATMSNNGCRALFDVLETFSDHQSFIRPKSLGKVRPNCAPA